MSDKNKKKPEYKFDDAVEEDSMRFSGKNDSRRIRKINPLGYRVVVKVVKDDNMTDAGLYLPEGAKQNMQESLLAEVIEVASAIDEDTHEEANVSGIPLGAKVLIPKDIGLRIPWDDELRIIETKHVLALIDEVRLT